MGIFDSLKNLFNGKKKMAPCSEVPMELSQEEMQKLDERMYQANMEKKKYILYRKEKTPVGELWRIVACKNFVNETPSYGKQEIKVGRLGGLVQSEDNLSHENNCWIDYDVIVYDKAKVSFNAYAEGNVIVSDSAVVTCCAHLIGCQKSEKKGKSEFSNSTQTAGNNSVQISFGNVTINGKNVSVNCIDDDTPLRVCGKAHVIDNAVVKDHACISEESMVVGEALVEGHACVKGKSIVAGNAKMRDNATIQDGSAISDSAEASGNAVIKGCSQLRHNAKISGNGTISEGAGAFGFSRIADNAQVSGNVELDGNAVVCGNAVMSGFAKAFEKAVVKDNAVVTNNATIRGCSVIEGNVVVP